MRDHTIVAAKDSSWLDTTNTANLLYICHGEVKSRNWKRDHGRPACYVPVCIKEICNVRKAVWFTMATVHWSNFCIFVDSIDSQIILRMIPESKRSNVLVLTLAIHINWGSVVIKQINMTSFIAHNRNSTITFAVKVKSCVFLVTYLLKCNFNKRPIVSPAILSSCYEWRWSRSIKKILWL